MTSQKSLEKPHRAGGVALWRRVADDIRLDITGGKFIDGGKLPSETELAARFSVNRHTVRRALAVLQDDGIVRTEQGRGTFVHRASRLSYPIGRRTRFSEGLVGQAGEAHSTLLSHRIEAAPLPVSKALNLSGGARVIRLEALGSADGKPLSRATIWVPASRFPNLAADYAQTASMTAALRRAGVEDYLRKETRISARYADVEEGQSLGLAPGAVLLVATYVNADAEGQPIQYAVTRFAAERIELVVGEQ